MTDTGYLQQLITIIDDLLDDLGSLRFGPPVTHVYNPLEYAWPCYEQYLNRYAGRPKEVVLFGMNPGPWGMVQTGIPFGEVNAVKGWLKIVAEVGRPKDMHPKRPVKGFDCEKSEVSGKRLWGWAKRVFGTPERFFSQFFVINYCPLFFIQENGRNRPPDQLRVSEREPLLAACDRALRRSIECMAPRYAVGVGRFAEGRAKKALTGLDVSIGHITHPSPANPKANRGWESLIEGQLRALGLRFPAPSSHG